MSEPFYLTTDPPTPTAHRMSVMPTIRRRRRDSPIQAPRRIRCAVPNRHRRARPENVRRRLDGMPTADFARHNSDQFQRLQEMLNISFGRFIGPPTPIARTHRLQSWQMADHGDIYLDSYAGWYSVRDERFFTEAETEVTADGTRVAAEAGTAVTLDRGADLLLSAICLRQTPTGALRRASSFIAPRCVATVMVHVLRGLQVCGESHGRRSAGVFGTRRRKTVMYV